MILPTILCILHWKYLTLLFPWIIFIDAWEFSLSINKSFVCQWVNPSSGRLVDHPFGWAGVKIAGWGSYTPHPVHPVSGTVGVGVPMKFHDGVGGGGVMAGYHHHNLMDMYPGPAINTMDWKNTSQVSLYFKDFI